MADPRSVVITGASRGLGLASAARLYAHGWHVLAAMRSPGAGLERLRSATGAAPGDPRLTAVTLDLTDPASITAAAKAITAAVGAPDVVVHNAAFVAVGTVEEMPPEVTERILTTNMLGPMRLTRELLPAMRQAGRGRVVVISSAGAIRGMPAISAYSASKGALERWAESLALEVAPFGLGVTVLSTGVFRTDLYDETYTTSYADREGPYRVHHAGIDRTGEKVIRSAKPPERFAAALEKALEDKSPFSRRAVGGDARMLLLVSRILPGRVFHSAASAVTGLPRAHALRADPVRLAPVTSPREESPAAEERLGEPSVQLYDDLEDFGNFDDAVAGDVRDPYPELARMRREEPVQRLDLSAMPHDDAKPVFFVYRYDDVARVLRDNETFSSSIVIDAFGEAFGKHVMLGMDEPQHRRHRALVAGAFSPKAIAGREHDLVERVASDLIDRFAGRGHAELVREFTFPYPTQVIAGLLGLPRADYPQFQRWSISLLSIHSNRERGLAASAALKEYFGAILADRRREPREDLISDLAHAEIDGERLSDEEIFSFLRLLLPAGVETTYRSTGNLLFGLLSSPGQLDAVRADRSLISRAIEESVRWEPPLLLITRVAARDTELSGVPIPAGSAVMPMLAAANREESRLEDPDRFDIFRPSAPHISFGHGVHICLGMHLARLEMRVAVSLLLDRLPGLRLDPEGDDPHIHGQVFRSPTSLPVLFDVPQSTGPR